jgi:acetyl esterase/lipase
MKIIAFLLFAFSILTAYAQTQAANGPADIEQKTFVYKTVGRLPIELDFFQPKANKIARPVIIWIHGGALMAGNRNGLREAQKRFYIDAGYSVVSIDYRLAPETKLPAIIDDLRDAVEWVRRNSTKLLNVDRTRIFVVGHSAGGYLALMTGYVLKNPPNAIISFYGYGDIQADWYSKPDPFYLTQERVTEEQVRQLVSDSAITSSQWQNRGAVYLYSRQNGKWPLMVGGHDPEKEASWFYKYCPLKNIHRNYPPVLLIHGDKDTDVPFEQSVLMDQELTLKKIKHKFIKMKGYGHGFENAEGAFHTPEVEKVFADIAAFLKENE